MVSYYVLKHIRKTLWQHKTDKNLTIFASYRFLIWIYNRVKTFNRLIDNLISPEPFCIQCKCITKFALRWKGLIYANRKTFLITMWAKNIYTYKERDQFCALYWNVQRDSVENNYGLLGTASVTVHKKFALHFVPSQYFSKLVAYCIMQLGIREWLKAARLSNWSENKYRIQIIHCWF